MLGISAAWLQLSATLSDLALWVRSASCTALFFHNINIFWEMTCIVLLKRGIFIHIHRHMHTAIYSIDIVNLASFDVTLWWKRELIFVPKRTSVCWVVSGRCGLSAIGTSAWWSCQIGITLQPHQALKDVNCQ